MKLIIPEVKREWISVKDELPKIPKGDYAVAVLVAKYDSFYESLYRGYGYSVRKGMFGKWKKGEFFKGTRKNDFMELYHSKNSCCWGPTTDPITHWMYLPDPPQYKYTEGELKRYENSRNRRVRNSRKSD
jgi:hypothetical protein